MKKWNGHKFNGYSGIYACHKYWGKKPPEVLEKILTNFGFDQCKVMDPFLGAGIIAHLSLQKGFNFFGCDLNPAAVTISNIFLSPPSSEKVLSVLDKIGEQCKSQINASYQGHDGTIASHIIWNGGSVVEIWTKQKSKTHLANVQNWLKKNNYFPDSIKLQNISDRVLNANSRINVAEGQKVSDLFTKRAIGNIDRLVGTIDKLAPEEQKIAYFILTSALGQMSKMVFALKRRKKGKGNCSEYEVGSWIIGYWLPKTHFEVNCWNVFEGRARKFAKACSKIEQDMPLLGFTDTRRGTAIIECKDAFEYMAGFRDGTIDLIVTDPPHSDRIPYLELSEMWNTMLNKKVDFAKEWIASDSSKRDKTSQAYMSQIHVFFSEASRILSNDGCLVFMFNCTDLEVWNEIREASSNVDCLQFKGRFPLKYSANSLVQDSRPGALKVDWCLVFGKPGFYLSDHIANNFTDWTNGWLTDGYFQS